MRIVPLAPSNTEILVSLGAEEHIVASTNYCPIKGKKIGGWTTPSLEEIISAKPDVLLGSMYIPPKIREWAEKEGVELRIYEPRTLEDIYDSIRDMGRLVGASLKAEVLIADMKMKINAIKKEGRELAQTYKARVYCEEFHNPPMVAGNWVPELVKLAGGAPMGEAGKPSRKVSKEEVERFSPDVAVLHWCGFGKKIPKDALEERGWNVNAHVKVIHDSILNRPSPVLCDGLAELHRTLKRFVERLKN